MFKRYLAGCLLAGIFAVIFGCPPLAGAQGVDSYTKLMLHADGSDQGTSFTDSATAPKTVTNTETYDSYTKLMLHMEGSGNSFTDSAASKAVTANGDVTQTTAQLKLGGKSAVFDGNGDYLTLADSEDWNFGSGNFTIDFWIRFNSVNGSQMPSGWWSGSTGTYSWRIHYYGDQPGMYFQYSTDGTNVFNGIGSVWTPSPNTWYHVAIVRHGADGLFFVNGVKTGATGNFGTDVLYSATSPLYIGSVFSGGEPGYLFNGYLDEFRISKGIARWTSDFTPPSSPYGKIYTVTGTKKFGTASGEFHGSGDYLTVPDSDDWNFGSGDFTIDFWVRFNTLPSANGSMGFFGQIDGTPTKYNAFQVTNYSGTYTFEWTTWVSGTGNTVYISNSTSLSTGIWYHIAIVRAGNNFLMFKDGTQIGTSLADSSQVEDVVASIEIGRFNNTYYLDGCLDEYRISKGIARWTSNFTPPSAPYDVDTTSPTVSSTSPASNSTGVGASSAVSATFSEDMDSSTITTSTFTLSSSSGSSVSGTVSYSNKTATFTPSSNLSYATTYTATITTGVKDISGNAMSSSYSWSLTTGSAPDTTAPSGSVSINSGASYTNSTAVTLTLTATDNVGVVGYYLSTSSSTPVASASGWNSVTSATSYTGSVSYSLTSGDEQKTVYVWYKDAAGNVSSQASDSITLDTTAPIVTITSPTSDPYTATSNTVSLEGSSSDTTSGVKEVTWSNDKVSSGTASGTTYWSISSVSLSSGDNKITVTAKDFGGNTSTDTITVTYSAATKPTVTTGSTSNVTATSATLTGTVNANGLSTTAWFEYGTVQGTYGNKSSTQTVTGSNDTTVSSTITGLTSETTYYYRIAAQNNSGTSYGSEMTFIYSAQCSMPTVTTESATNVTSTTATLNGTINANSFSTTAWFEYGKQSGVYGSKSDTKEATGSTDTKVSISVKNLTSGTTYYFRIVAQNCGGTTYGEEMTFYYTTQTEAPSVATEAATNVTATSAILNGEVNPNGLSTTAWFEYGTLKGTYKYKTDTQSLSGSSYTKVSAVVTGLTAGTTYYYRIAAQNSVGTSYGTEMTFYKSPGGTDTTPTPTATPKPTPTQTATPTPTATPIQTGKGSIYGYVKDSGGNTLQGVGVTIVGANDQESTETDNRGYYEFGNLEAGNYTLTYEEDGYKMQTRGVTLGEGEEKDLGTVILEEVETETTGKIYGYVVDIRGEPIESVRLKLKGLTTKVKATETSDGDGFFEFLDLGADRYLLTVQKKRYRKSKQTITLEEGESREIEIEMRKTSKRIKGL